MRRNEAIRFDEPRRQSYSAILFFTYRFFKIVVRQLWPILIAFLFGKEQTKTIFLYVIIGISAVILIFSVISFFRYYFYIKDGELIVRKGVFQRSVTNIPFERIQTINFEQNLLHQVFNVVKLEIDTAGSKGNEFSFAALDKSLAVALREEVLKNKKENHDSASDDPDQTVPVQQEKVVMRLNISELLKLGLGQNHLRSFLLIIFFFSWILQQLNELGMDTDEMIGEIDPEAIMAGKIAVISLAVLSILITLLISLVRTFLRFYDFKLMRTPDGFKVESGLLNRRQIAARDHKIQIVSWADNPLKRMIGIHDVFLKQASSIQVQNKKSIVIPGCEKDNLEKIKSYYFTEKEWLNLETFQIHPKYILRRFLYRGLLPAILLFGAISYFFTFSWALLSLAWLPLSFVMARKRFQRWRINLNNHILYVEHGLFGHYNKSIKLYKIQNISLNQSWYQRRHRLCTLSVFTASGKITIPFLNLELGRGILDYLLYKVESDKRSWM